VLGFLVYNTHPATIFMGDCGSLLLGFVLSATALLSDYDRTRNVGVVLFAPMLILLIPIFDTCVVTVTRKLAGRPISQGGRDHTSHRLVALGLSEQRAVWLLYGLAIAAGTLAILARSLRAEALFWLIPSISLVILFLGLYLGRVRVYESEQIPSGFTVPNVIADFAYKRRIFEILLDVMLASLAYYGAYLLRFDGGITQEQMRLCLQTLPLVIAAQLLFLLVCGVYRGLWRYAGLSDLLTIAKAVLTGTVAAGIIVSAFFDWETAGLTLFVLYGLLLFTFITVSRWSFRLLRALVEGLSSNHPDALPVLIYGAGDRGVWLLSELRNNPALRCVSLGFIDDDPRKAERRIHGCRIYSRDQLPELITKYQIAEVLISTPQIPAEPINELRKLGLKVSRLQIRLERDSEMVASHV
jgi:UDP-GlcNAc:undecaprenyl-phosphate/decaprenyl-phosphate GlcNAc-1-phosphate transferase